MKPWMTWEGVYQSLRCWEFSELITTPCQNFTKPHLQMGSRPMLNRMMAMDNMIPSGCEITP